MTNKVVVTGGGGFIGAHLVRRLVHTGWEVAVVDTMLRGAASRFEDVASEIEVCETDVRDENGLITAFSGAELVIHLAAVNGTENFYKHPELVLDVGIRGMLAVVNACRRAEVPDLVVASSAEVYQTPEVVPTPENVALMLPDSINPRYSYGGSKIATELIAFDYAREHFRKMQVFRPHNVYGPDMGWKHVIPQFIVRAIEVLDGASGPVPFRIQGNGEETRAFCYVEDAINGILTMYEKGNHREIFHIGNDEEVSIRELVDCLSEIMNGELTIVASPAAAGGTPRRCPDISKISALGYEPEISLTEGLRRTVEWYRKSGIASAENELM